MIFSKIHNQIGAENNRQKNSNRLRFLTERLCTQ
jgi:hypothetical protein